MRAAKGRPGGTDTICKSCHAAGEAERKRPKPKPGALVLVMPPRPTPDAEPEPPTEGPPAPVPPPAAHYADQVERFLRVLDPPHGDADALLVHSLRHLASLADRCTLVGALDPVRDLSTLTQRMIQVQRELAATRAAKASAGTSPPVTKSKFEAFKEAQ